MTHNKEIDCPKHPGQHNAVLDIWPSKSAGYWTCPVTEESEEHNHEGHEQTEDVEVDTMSNGEHDTYTIQIYSCEVCGIRLEGDPQVDAHESKVDMEIMRARDK